MNRERSTLYKTLVGVQAVYVLVICVTVFGACAAQALSCSEIFTIGPSSVEVAAMRSDVYSLRDGLILELTPPLTASDKRSRAERPDLFQHPDPFACGVCVGATEFAIPFLNKRSPVSDWMHARAELMHSYAYSKSLDFIVDPTYRQYLVHLPKTVFDKLPRIFMGTPAELRRRMRELGMDNEFIDLYLSGYSEKSGISLTAKTRFVESTYDFVERAAFVRVHYGRLVKSIKGYHERGVAPERILQFVRGDLVIAMLWPGKNEFNLSVVRGIIAEIEKHR